MNKEKLLLYLTLIFLGIFFIAIRWTSFNVPLERDEGEYAYTAQIMRQGASPYNDVYNQKPPLIYYTYYLIYMLGVDGLWLYRVVSSLFIFLAILLVGFIAYREFGTKEALLAMWIFVLIINYPFLSPFAANTEVFMILPLTGLLAIYIVKKEKAHPSHFFWAGVLASLAVFYKPICVLTILFIFWTWIRQLIKGKNEKLSVLRKTLSFLAGGSLISFLILLPIARLGALESFWDVVVRYNSYYYPANGLSVKFLIVVAEFILNMPVVVLSLLYFLIKKPHGWKFWAGVLLFSLLGIYRTNLEHYYILIVPTLAIISAKSLVMSSDELTSFLKLGQWRSFIRTTFIGFAFLTTLWPIVDIFSISPKEFIYKVYGDKEPFYESPAVSSRLSELTKPSELVYIAGSEPQILFYSKRKSVSKFVYTYPLIIDTPVRQDLQDQLIEELEKTPPSVIVYSSAEKSWDKDGYVPVELIEYLKKLVGESYVPVGGFIRHNHGEYWQEPIATDDLEKASLVLYKKVN